MTAATPTTTTSRRSVVGQIALWAGMRAGFDWVLDYLFGPAPVPAAATPDFAERPDFVFRKPVDEADWPQLTGFEEGAW